MPAPSPPSPQGFTLVEILIAAAVLTVVVAGFVLVSLQSQSAVEQSGLQRQAVNIAAYVENEITKGNSRYTPPAGSIRQIGGEELLATVGFSASRNLNRADRYKVLVSSLGPNSLGLNQYQVAVCWADGCTKTSALGGQVSNNPSATAVSSSTQIPLATRSLRVQVSGPAEITPDVEVAGSRDSFRVSALGITQLDNLQSPSYSVRGNTVQGERYTFRADTSSVNSATPGVIPTAQVSYTAATGAVQVNVVTASGITPNVTLTSSTGTSQPIASSQLLRFADPGTYTLSAQSVRCGSFMCSPRVQGSPAVVRAGETATLSVSYGSSTGSLNVVFDPEAPSATVVISGVGTQRTLKTSGLLTDLAPGSYTLTAEPFKSASYTYAMQPLVVDVVAGQQANATLDFRATDGALEVTAVGLPAGVYPGFSVGGERSVFTSADLAGSGLRRLFAYQPAGSVRVTGESFQQGGFTYTAAASNPTVVAGQTATATLNYQAVDGGLEVRFAGLPSGLSPQAVVEGGNFKQTLTADSRLSGLKAGQYRITPAVVGDAGGRYEAAAVTATVTNGSVSGLTITYQPVPYLEVLVNLPQELSQGRVLVSGSGGSFTVTQTRRFYNLAAGNYVVTPLEVTLAGNPIPYQGFPLSQTVSLGVGTGGSAVVNYRPSMGLLNLTLDGPTGATVRITDRRSSQLVRTVSASGSQLLPPGPYLLEYPNLTVSGQLWEGGSRNVEVIAGQTLSVPLSWTSRTGNLEIVVTPPAGITPSLTLRDAQGLTRTISASTTLTAIAPSVYSISGAEVQTSDGARWQPSASPATVEAGKTARMSVTYKRTNARVTLTFTVPSGTPAFPLSARLTASGFNQTLTLTQTLDLRPGLYTLVAPATVSYRGLNYALSVAQNPISVEPGADQTISVSYLPTNGALSITVVAPSGSSPPAELFNPFGQKVQTLSVGANNLTGLTPGKYSLRSERRVRLGDYLYDPDGTGEVVVTAGQTTSQTLTYRPLTGSLLVQSNQPSLAVGVILERLTDGQRSTVSLGVPMHLLEPGRYRLSTPELTTAISILQTPDLEVEVKAGETTSANLTTTDVAARLTVKSSLTGMTGTASVNGPQGYTVALGGTLQPLRPGTYTVSLPEVVTSSNIYQTPEQTITLSAGQNATVTLTTTDVAARLTVRSSVTGLSATAIVSGPQDSTVALGGTLQPLRPGSYTVRLGEVVTTNNIYQTADQNITLTAGQNATLILTTTDVAGRIVVQSAVSGLSGNAQVSGNSQNLSVALGGTAQPLRAGSYSVSLPEISNATGIYQTPSQSASVNAGQTVTVRLQPRLVTATLTVTSAVAGLSGSATVTNSSSGASASVALGGTTGILGEGPYQITLPEITNATGIYQTPAINVNLVGGQNQTVALQPQLVSGRIALTINLPSAITGQSVGSLVGPSLNQSLTGSYTLFPARVGSYQLNLAPSLTSPQGLLYRSSASSETLSLAAGATLSRSVSYSTTQARINFTTNGQARLSCNGQTYNPGPVILEAPATCRVLAPEYRDGIKVFNATRDGQTFSVSQAEVRDFTVSYSPVNILRIQSSFPAPICVENVGCLGAGETVKEFRVPVGSYSVQFPYGYFSDAALNQPRPSSNNWGSSATDISAAFRLSPVNPSAGTSSMSLSFSRSVSNPHNGQRDLLTNKDLQMVLEIYQVNLNAPDTHVVSVGYLRQQKSSFFGFFFWQNY